MSGYVIATCHEGTDWCVRDFDSSQDEEDERFDNKEDALRRARLDVVRLNSTLRKGMVQARVYDFTSEEAV
jgi:hypothetical protein